ncbi:MAG: hypothetical protein R2711_09435 [Acidimicrobiales bacterium]
MGRRSRRDVPRRLAVIGDTQHYRDDQGRLCALEPVVLSSTCGRRTSSTW